MHVVKRNAKRKAERDVSLEECIEIEKEAIRAHYGKYMKRSEHTCTVFCTCTKRLESWWWIGSTGYVSETHPFGVRPGLGAFDETTSWYFDCLSESLAKRGIKRAVFEATLALERKARLIALKEQQEHVYEGTQACLITGKLHCRCEYCKREAIGRRWKWGCGRWKDERLPPCDFGKYGKGCRCGEKYVFRALKRPPQNVPYRYPAGWTPAAMRGEANQ